MNGMLFFCSEPETLQCADAGTGKIVWEKTNSVDDAATPEEKAKMEEAAKALDPVGMSRMSGSRRMAGLYHGTPVDVGIRARSVRGRLLAGRFSAVPGFPGRSRRQNPAWQADFSPGSPFVQVTCSGKNVVSLSSSALQPIASALNQGPRMANGL